MNEKSIESTDTKIFTIQRLLIEPNVLVKAVTPRFLRKSSVYLSPDYYQEVVTERANMGICGYPICVEPICNVPRYRIAYNEGKIYDNTKLKEFCSGDCMLASAVYVGQLSLESIYHRDMSNMKLPVLHEKKKSNSQTQLVNNNPIKSVTPNFGNLLTEIKEKEPSKEEEPKIPSKREFKTTNSFKIEGYTPKHEAIKKKSKITITGTKFLFEDNKNQPQIKFNTNLNQNLEKTNQQSNTIIIKEVGSQNLEPIPPFTKQESNEREVMPESNSSEELYSSDEDLQPQTVPTLTDLEVSNFGFVWNALMEMVTQETIFYCNGLPLPKPKSQPSVKKSGDNNDFDGFVLPPVDSISVDAGRRSSFNQLIQKHINDINSSLKLSVPIFAEFQGCVNTFQFRSSLSVKTQAQWGAIALAIVLSLKKRRYCEDFVQKLDSNIESLCQTYEMNYQDIQIITALLTGD